ncbi:MAG: hypothetical protein IPP38_10550 [Bacteroidetes bacterium]|nr:hypothetical protein [Bacteroidota bacterium]
MIENSVQAEGTLNVAFQKHARKGIISQIAYAVAIPMAYVHPLISGALFFSIAILWLIPDKEIEKAVS